MSLMTINKKQATTSLQMHAHNLSQTLDRDKTNTNSVQPIYGPT